jgi:hypothetical protein
MEGTMKKKQVIASIVVVLAFLLFLSGGLGLAAILNVDGSDSSCDDFTGMPYCTIQAAVSAATPGSTIEVAAGLYTENVIIRQSLTLNGAQAGIDARNRVATESEVTAVSGNVFYVTTGDVTIDGFNFSGNGASKLLFADNANNLIFQNNILDGTAGSGAWFGTTSAGVTINQNEFDGTSLTDYLLFFDGGSDVFNNLTISDNDFLNGEVFAGAQNFNSSYMMMSANLFDNANANLSSAFKDSEIDGNTFRNNSYTNAQFGLQNSTISNNVFENAGPSPYSGYPSYAMMLWGYQYGLTPSENVTIEGNTFYFNEIDASNEVSSGVRILSGIDATTIDVHYNNFIDGGMQADAFALLNQASGLLDATCNWWDNVSGPSGEGSGTGGAVSINVDYAPWLLTPAPDGPCADIGESVGDCISGLISANCSGLTGRDRAMCNHEQQDICFGLFGQGRP